MANHLRFDFDLVEFLARVDSDNTTNHLRHDNHITEVGLDKVWLLVRLCLLLRLSQLFNEAHGLALQTPVEPTAGTGVNEIAEFF